MFPLGSVLLPGEVLPLHVFEPRYLEMMGDCLRDHEREFGVVLIERGSEVGGGDRRLGHGTVARMVQIGELGEGRLLVVCVGTRRIRVRAWLPDDPYPLADVDDWPDSWSDDDRARAAADGLSAAIAVLASRVRRAHALAVELGDRSAGATLELGDDPLEMSYQLAAMLPVGPVDQHQLLAAAGPAERIQKIAELLDDVEVLQQFRLADAGGRFGVDPDE
jgi:Lon protease-like protein